MFRKIAFLALFMAGCFPAFSRGGGSHLRISLLTCGPGDEAVWEVFGHTGLRVVDSQEHTDMVYNYGTFDFGPDFEIQFMRGKLLYSLTVMPFQGFMQEYLDAKRKVEEQVLLLDTMQKERLYYFLEWNAEPENKYYKYDFFFDNCATRIRDIFPRPEIFGKTFRYGETMPAGQRISFRDIINRYFYRDHWTRVGVNILLGSRIDKPMTSKDIMFLPDYLRDGIGGGSVKGQPIASPSAVLLPQGPQSGSGPNWPFMVGLLVLALTIAGFTLPGLRILGSIMSTLLLSVTGILGMLILVMWFWTDHQGCANNYNLLWCLPTNIIIAFFRPKGRGRYAILAILMLLTTLVLHLLRVQCLTLLELSPILLSLLLVYGSVFRRSNLKPVVKNA